MDYFEQSQDNDFFFKYEKINFWFADPNEHLRLTD